MGKNKISLSFVNEGESFTVPHMTVKSQEMLFKDMTTVEKTYKQDTPEFMRELNKYMLLRVLQNVDDSITLDDINNMHPDDFVELLTLINDRGRELTKSDAGNFRNRKPKKKK